MKRREFLGGVAAFGASPLLAVPELGRIARIGLMTDTHVGMTLESCSRVKAALELFKAKGAEMVINCGDIADRHYPAGYRCYRQTVNAVYPEAAARPKEIFVYADHDLIDHDRHIGRKDPVAAFENVRRLLEIPHPPACDFVWKGLPFVVCTQDTGRKGFPSWKDYEATVERVCAANPGRPVFVCDHLPPAGTTFHSWHWGSANCRSILNRFPQVVSLSGHVHGSLVCERQIWQGEFTAVNIGCLQTWGGFAPGSTPPPQAKQNYGVLVMDVYRDRLVFFRYDVRDGAECGTPWVVPLPFAAGSAPYVPATAAKRVKTLPAFAAGAAVAVDPVGAPVSGYAISFPEAAGPDAFMYRIRCARRSADGTWVPFTQDDIFSEFWKRGQDRTGKARHVLHTGFFTPGETYRVSVSPLDFFYRETKGISCTFTASHSAGKVVWQIADPTRELRFTEHGRPVAVGADGWLAPSSGQGTLWLPDGAFAGLEGGSRHQLILDLDADQPGGDWCAWRLKLRPRDVYRSVVESQTATGRPGTLRYVMSFTPPKDGAFPGSCDLVFDYVSPRSRFRIAGIRLLADGR